MPGGFPQEGGLCNGTPFNLGVAQLTPSATANLFGAYTTISAKSPLDVCALHLDVFSNPQTAAATLSCYNIAIGPGGSEAIIIPNIVVDAAQQFGATVFHAVFPVRIPTGTRIAANCLSNAASSTLYYIVNLNGYDGDFATTEGYCNYDSLGVSGSPPLGVALTPSATSNVKGAYSQLVAAALRTYNGFVVNTDGRGIARGGDYLIDIAIGSAGNEVVIAPNIYNVSAPTGGVSVNSSFLPITIPAGQRVSARCSSSIGSDSHTIGVSLLAAY